MLLFLGILLVIGLVGLAWWSQRNDCFETTVWSSICGGILGLALLITGIAYPVEHISKLQEMIVFHNVNSEAYAETVTATRVILSEEKFVESLIIEGSIEKMGVAVAVSERIVEWRDNIVLYNIALQQFRYWDSNIWLGCYFPTPPEDLKFLSIGSD